MRPVPFEDRSGKSVVPPWGRGVCRGEAVRGPGAHRDQQGSWLGSHLDCDHCSSMSLPSGFVCTRRPGAGRAPTGPCQGETGACEGVAAAQAWPLSEDWDRVKERGGHGQERLETKAAFREAEDGEGVGWAQSGFSCVLSTCRAA